MKNVTLGSTGLTAPQNGFGALPLQRVDNETAVSILRNAYEGGMRFFDTARAYSDSEEKLGLAFGPGSLPDGDSIRNHIILATKTQAKNVEEFWEDLNTSLKTLKTDYIDIYQFHCVDQCWVPGDGTGMYEAMLEAKEKGLIRHIGVTAHKVEVAFDCVNSGYYETMQFPFSYLCSKREEELVALCKEKNVGFIAMKGLAGGLLTNADAIMAFMQSFDNVMPIWGIQKQSELEEWLSFFSRDVEMSDDIRAYIEKEKAELSGDFCRGCGYCMPCPMGIEINNCARMSLMLRRAPSDAWLTEEWQEKMNKIDTCINCRICTTKCPYELDTPELLKRNLKDYREVLEGKVSVK